MPVYAAVDRAAKFGSILNHFTRMVPYLFRMLTYLDLFKLISTKNAVKKDTSSSWWLLICVENAIYNYQTWYNIKVGAHGRSTTFAGLLPGWCGLASAGRPPRLRLTWVEFGITAASLSPLIFLPLAFPSICKSGTSARCPNLSTTLTTSPSSGEYRELPFV